MLIILEGTDCTGKSTLAAELCKRTNAHLLHRGPPERDPLDEYVTDIQETSYRGRLVCDRWHLGELVWPHIYGRESSYTDAQFNYTEAFLRARGAIVVHCTGNYDDIAKRLARRGDATFKLEHLRAALLGFQRVVHRSVLEHVMYSIEQPLDLDALLHRARVLEAGARLVDDRFVGEPVTPWLLLVGDTPGVLGAQLPFLPRPSTSGHFLFGLPLPWRDIAVTNANDAPVTALKKQWTLLGQPRTVALGRQAARTLDELAIPRGLVPHPQFVRRFHHDRGLDYVDAILAAARGIDTMDRFPR